MNRPKKDDLIIHEMMKIIFVGTTVFAVPILDALIHKYEVLLVVTQPDRRAGRKQMLKPSPVKTFALKNQLDVFQPENIRKEYQLLIDLNPDLIVVAAYGQMIPSIILKLPKFHCINVHASLLPKYRGGAPMHRAIMNGDTETGVTVMYMADKMDSGMILSQKTRPIQDSDTVGSIEHQLAIDGSELLLATLPKVFDGSVIPIAQDETKVTIASNIRHEDEFIDFNKTKKQIFDHVRALNPWPVAAAKIDNILLKIYSVVPLSDNWESYEHHANGTIIKANNLEVLVKVADGIIALKYVQIAGKKLLDIKDLMNGSGKNIFTVGKIIN